MLATPTPTLPTSPTASQSSQLATNSAATGAASSIESAYVADILERVRVAEAAARDAQNTALISSGIIVILGILGGASIIRYLKSRVSQSAKSVEKIVVRDLADKTAEATTAFRNDLDRRLEDTLTKLTNEGRKAHEIFLSDLSDKTLTYSAVQAHHAADSFDDAIAFGCPSGQYNDIANLPSPIQRVLIDSLSRASMQCPDLEIRRKAAIQLATKLLQSQPSLENLQTALKAAVHARNHQSGLTLYMQYAGSIPDAPRDMSTQQFMLVIYRHLGDYKRAFAAAAPYRETTSPIFINNYAALYRDFARFSDAHRLMHPHANKIIRDGPSRLPDKWDYLLNTFISNCIDLGKPTQAFAHAKFLILAQRGSVQAFTAARLAKELPAGSDDQKWLVSQIEHRLDDLWPDDTAIMARSVILAATGRHHDSVKILKEALSGENYRGWQRYYLLLLLAQTLMEHFSDRLDEALRVLADARKIRPNEGEGLLTLADCEFRRGNHEAALEAIKASSSERLRWVVQASSHIRLSTMDEVQRLASAATYYYEDMLKGTPATHSILDSSLGDMVSLKHDPTNRSHVGADAGNVIATESGANSTDR